MSVGTPETTMVATVSSLQLPSPPLQKLAQSRCGVDTPGSAAWLPTSQKGYSETPKASPTGVQRPRSLVGHTYVPID